MNPPEKSLSVRPLAVLATLYGVTERTLSRWKAQGVEIQDEKAVEAYRATLQQNKVTVDTKGLREEKLKADTRYKQAQAERAELLLAQAKGELLSIPEMAEIYLATASAVKAQLLRFEGELPGMLEGLAAADMVPVIHARVEAVLRFLAQELGGEIDAPPRGEKDS